MPDHDTLTALLRDWAVVRGDQEAVVFATDPTDAAGDQCLTYAELDRAARRVAALLHLHADPGDRVLLLNEPGLGFVTAFVGCVYAGMIAVPAPPPGGHRSHQARLAGIARDAGVKVALAERAGLDAVQEWADDAGLDTMKPLAVDGALPPAEQWADPGTTDAKSLVFLQYTSGSTGDPKGVMVDHGNVRANTEIFCQVTGATPSTRFGGWLPTFHDFGLIGLLLTPLCLGATTVLMSPLAFVKRPYAWLRLLDRHRVNLTAAPNFAFDLCVRVVTETQAAGIDLSSVTQVLNGSEPIRAETQQAFIERFRPHGLDPVAMLPAYGLAEATLAVSCSDHRRGPVTTGVDALQLALGHFVPASPSSTEEHIRHQVSSGLARDDIVIVDPVNGEILPDGRIGEIWVRGPQVARGYWNRPDTTRAVFGATTNPATNAATDPATNPATNAATDPATNPATNAATDPATDRGGGDYLRTGDLGTKHDGQFYVTGRIKEVLIVHGQNLYPQDLEATVRAAHPALARGVGAVFTVPTPDEEIVIVQECRAHALEDMTPSGLAAQIRSAIRRDFGVAIGGVVLVRPSQVRRTTSGKIQRGLTRDLFTQDELKALHEDLTPAVRARYRVT